MWYAFMVHSELLIAFSLERPVGYHDDFGFASLKKSI